MKIINKITNEVIATIMTNHGMTLDEAIALVGEIHNLPADEPNVEIYGEWCYYDDLDIVADDYEADED